jgi:hypothetical protein
MESQHEGAPHAGSILTGLGFLGEFSRKIRENLVSLMIYCARDNINFFVVSKAFSAKKNTPEKR